MADDPTRNHLLGALSAEELTRIRPHLEPVDLKQGQVLFESERPIQYVYFPQTSVLSLVGTLREGGTVEVGTVGCEGMAGLSVFLADDRASYRALAQLPGAALRIDSVTFMELAVAGRALHAMLLRYTQAFLTQVAQTAVCNAGHLIEQRCARWLLMTHDRVDGDAFPLTHEFLAFMLGVRRAGVTVAMGTLQERGLLRYTRGRVQIRDRAGLERISCECYSTVRAHFERLLPKAA